MAAPQSLDLQINQHLQNLKASQMPMMRPGGPAPQFGMQGGPPMGGPPPFGMQGGGMQQPVQVPAVVQPPGGKGGPAGPPTLLSVAIDNIACRYQLNEADVGEAFLRWGQLQNVQIYREGSRDVGVVNFADPVDASDAQRQLNGAACNFENSGPGTLVVINGPPEQLSPPISRTGGQFPQSQQVGPGGPPQMAAVQQAPGQGPPMAPSGGQGPPGGGMPPQSGHPGGQPGPAPGQPMQQGQPPQPGQPGEVNSGKGEPMDGKACGKGGANIAPAPGAPAWSCKVIVQAEMLHPGFPIASKIVGPNNANVEHMRTQLLVQVQLRGRGSGTLEPDGQELQEPMALWFSAEKAELGPPAVEMSKDLLGSVYEEHKQFCLANGQQPPQQTIEPVIIPGPGAGGAPNPGAAAPGPSPGMAPGQGFAPGPGNAMAPQMGPGPPQGPGAMGPGPGFGGPGPCMGPGPGMMGAPVGKGGPYPGGPMQGGGMAPGPGGMHAPGMPGPGMHGASGMVGMQGMQGQNPAMNGMPMDNAYGMAPGKGGFGPVNDQFGAPCGKGGFQHGGKPY